MVSTKTKKARSTERAAGRSRSTASEERSESSPKRKLTTPPVEREIIYPEIDVQLAVGEDAINEEKAKQILGWQAETENLKISSEDLTCKDENGCRVRCCNDQINRPLYRANIEVLKQEILMGRWRMNCEPIIVGKSGQLLDGQHTLIALVFACQEYAKNPGRWLASWKTPPTIEKLVVLGADEDSDTVNTMNTAKPRSICDVLYRSSFFSDDKKKDRLALAKMMQYSIKFLWRRTGQSSDAQAPRMTNAEQMKFIDRHPRLLRSVRHIYVEDGGSGSLLSMVPLGAAAGLHYLMGVSGTEDDSYGFSSSLPTEDLLDFSMWDKADEFWVCLAAGDAKLAAVRQAIATIADDETIANPRTVGLSVVTAAWNLWVAGKPVTAKAIALDFVTTETGRTVLSEVPTVSGIDLGESTP